MRSNRQTLLIQLAVIVFISTVFIAIYMKNDKLDRSVHYLKFYAEDLQSYWESVCSKGIYVFCDDKPRPFREGFFREEKLRGKLLTERAIGSTTERKSNSTAREKFALASQELVSDPYYRVNRRLRGGQPVVIHVVNPAPWLVNDLQKNFRCPANACVFDMDRVTEETDVIMAHGVKLTDGMMPSRRWPGQLYIMYGRESPLHYHSDIQEDSSTWRYAFNLTSTYRIDSDIFWPYGRLDYSPWPANQKPDFHEIARNKDKLAVWLVSNCHTPSLRKEYVEEMKKYMPVDIFGRCGNASDCPRDRPGERIDQCMDALLTPYRFYLSFENSLCPDYVTEKVFKTFRRNLNIIPVVRGGAEYDRLFPRGAFINAGWFRTARELALYLKEMPEETYAKYLEANRLFREGPRYSIACFVCDAVILQRATPRMYDIKTWLEQKCPVPRFL
ncbi:hypothetical protein Btru_005086 [Bulinus truncatus]|nr:hypothetical protein Btru_005086 [Bulinus truncatus]